MQANGNGGPVGFHDRSAPTPSGRSGIIDDFVKFEAHPNVRGHARSVRCFGTD